MLNHGVVAERIVRKSPYGVMYRRGRKYLALLTVQILFFDGKYFDLY